MPHDFKDIKSKLLIDGALFSALDDLHSAIATTGDKKKFLKELKVELRDFSALDRAVLDKESLSQIVEWRESKKPSQDSRDIEEAVIDVFFDNWLLEILKTKTSQDDIARSQDIFWECLHLIGVDENKLDRAFGHRDFVQLLESVVDQANRSGEIDGRFLLNNIFEHVVRLYYQRVDFERNAEALARCDFLFGLLKGNFKLLKESEKCLREYELLKEVYVKKALKWSSDQKFISEVDRLLREDEFLEGAGAAFCKARCESLCFEIERYELSLQQPSYAPFMNRLLGTEEDVAKKVDKNTPDLNTKKMLALLQFFPIAKFYNFLALHNASTEFDLYSIKDKIVAGAKTDIVSFHNFIDDVAEKRGFKLLIFALDCALEVSKSIDLGNKIDKIIEAAKSKGIRSHEIVKHESGRNAGKMSDDEYAEKINPTIQNILSVYERVNRADLALLAAKFIATKTYKDRDVASEVLAICTKEVEKPENTQFKGFLNSAISRTIEIIGDISKKEGAVASRARASNLAGAAAAAAAGRS